MKKVLVVISTVVVAGALVLGLYPSGGGVQPANPQYWSPGVVAVGQPQTQYKVKAGASPKVVRLAVAEATAHWTVDKPPAGVYIGRDWFPVAFLVGSKYITCQSTVGGCWSYGTLLEFRGNT